MIQPSVHKCEIQIKTKKIGDKQLGTESHIHSDVHRTQNTNKSQNTFGCFNKTKSPPLLVLFVFVWCKKKKYAFTSLENKTQ